MSEAIKHPSECSGSVHSRVTLNDNSNGFIQIYLAFTVFIKPSQIVNAKNKLISCVQSVIEPSYNGVPKLISPLTPDKHTPLYVNRDQYNRSTCYGIPTVYHGLVSVHYHLHSILRLMHACMSTYQPTYLYTSIPTIIVRYYY